MIDIVELPSDSDHRNLDWHEFRSSCAIFENRDVLVLNKPPGLSVTGERNGVDIVELAHGADEQLYPVHRIDKVTSGIVLFAKRLEAHGPLTRQFARRTVHKGYLAVVKAAALPASWTIDLPLSVGRKNTVRVAGSRESIRYDIAAATFRLDAGNTLRDKRVYPSVTRLHRLHEHEGCTVLLAIPVTGRRHQIRVHLAWTGAPIVGDPLFPSTSMHATSGRTHLHSWRLSLEAPWARSGIADFAVAPDGDFLSRFADCWKPEVADAAWRGAIG